VVHVQALLASLLQSSCILCYTSVIRRSHLVLWHRLEQYVRDGRWQRAHTPVPPVQFTGKFNQ